MGKVPKKISGNIMYVIFPKMWHVFPYIYIFFACSSKCGGKLCYGTSYCLAGTLFLNYCEFDENPSTISSYFSVFVTFGYDHDQDKDRHIFEPKPIFSTKKFSIIIFPNFLFHISLITNSHSFLCLVQVINLKSVEIVFFGKKNRI